MFFLLYTSHLAYDAVLAYAPNFSVCLSLWLYKNSNINFLTNQVICCPFFLQFELSRQHKGLAGSWTLSISELVCSVKGFMRKEKLSASANQVSIFAKMRLAKKNNKDKIQYIHKQGFVFGG